MRRFLSLAILALSFGTAPAAESITQKFERATRDQLGVIGEDFPGDVRIGVARNENGYEPVDAHKRTFSGLLTSVVGNGEYAKGDWDFGLRMIGENAIVRANLTRLTSKKLSHPLGDLVGAVDFKGEKPGSYGYLKYSPSLPAPMIDGVGMYGPWVFRRRSGKTSIEIHPMNQLWWTTKAKEGRRFHLLILNDLSGRFAHYDDFEGSTKDLEASWLGGYRSGALRGSTFAVAYELRGKTVYEISSPSLRRPRLSIGKRRTRPLGSAGSTSVVQGVEDLSDVIDVGVERDPSNDKRGFIVIRTKYLGNAANAGESPEMLSLVVSEHVSLPKPPKRVRVTLDSIHCLGADDSGGIEELIGYVGVRATDGVWPALANVAPKEGSPLLWKALDDGIESAPLRLGKNQAKEFGKSVEYELAAAATLTLVADLDEDDASGDKNATKLDGDDDRLEQACKACFRNVPVKDLVPGKPLRVEFGFGSGGTRVMVRLTVEAL